MAAQPPENSVQVETRTEWRDWLTSNHTRPEGIWLITYKKAPGNPYVSYDEVVE